MNIILLGAPGAGKGTQADRICAKYSLPHISTGDIFRYNIKEKTEIGLVAKSYIDKGQLVPDEVTVEIVRQRLAEADCERGFVLDGFPRTVFQAEALSKLTAIDAVVDIEIPLERLMARLTGRRVCSGCGQTYHISNLEGRNTCAKCGENLYQRADDNSETVKNRIDVYTGQTKPLIEFYNVRGLLHAVDGDKSAAEVFEEICTVLDTVK